MTTWHYDLVILCEKGDMHPTEDIGLTFEQAVRLLNANPEVSIGATYRIVSCDKPGSDSKAHSVDLGYHVHMNVHQDCPNWEYASMCGVPQDAWIDDDGGPELPFRLPNA